MARVYIHELVDVVGTRRADYQHHMTANWVPFAAAERRQRCFGVWTLVGSTGRWPQVVNLWEYDSWADLGHNFAVELSHPGHRDPVLAEWWDAAAAFRTGGFDRVLVAHDDSPGIEDWCARGGTGAAGYCHELLRCPPGRAARVADALVAAGEADHERSGLELVGVFRTALRADDEVLSIRAFPDWGTWAEHEAAIDRAGAGGDEVLERQRVLLVDAELSPLRTGRQPTAEDRRPLT